MQPSRSSSRPAPPAVPPVTHGGVRYQQVMNGHTLGLKQLTGNLAAFDEATGQQSWTIEVYRTVIDPNRETDVQEVYFQSMTFGDDGKLHITNERGASFVVDVDTRTVSAADDATP